MSYVTGLITDFENRMHQLGIDSGSMASYVSEGNTYLSSGTGIVSMQMSGKWEREARNQYWRMSNNSVYLNSGVFGAPTIITDTFQRANGLIGPNWFLMLSSESNNLAISSNQVVLLASNSSTFETVSHSSAFGADHYAEVTLGLVNAAATAGPAVRMTATKWYFAFVLATTCYLYEYDGGGAFNLLTSVAAAASNSGDIIHLEAAGTNPVALTVKINNITVITFNDSVYKLTGTAAGFAIYDNTGSTVSITKFQAAVINGKTITPYAGSGALQGWFNQHITVVNAGYTGLSYDKNQPWTLCAAVRIRRPTAGGLSPQVILFNGDSGPTYRGYELWVAGDNVPAIPQSRLVTRLISNYATNDYIGVYGSTNLADDQWHFVAATYDGTSSVTGIKLYVDGVLETMGNEGTALTGTIVSSSPMLVGEQPGGLYVRGFYDEVSHHNIARSAAYISGHSSSGSLPSIDANVQFYYACDEGTGSGILDSSLSGRNGILTTDRLWVTR